MKTTAAQMPAARTLEQARDLLGFRRRTEAPGCPLRYKACLVRVEGGYAVVDLGLAERLKLEVVRCHSSSLWRW